MRPLTTRLAVPILAATLACADAPDPDSWLGSVDTLPSGTVIVRNPSQGVWDEATQWELVEDLRLGSMDAVGPELFGSIGDFEVDDEGRIYILDRTAFEVRVFDREGVYLRSIGRQGEGPGEFKQPQGLEIDDLGRLWVVDSGNQRYSVFDTTGALVEEIRRFTGGNGPWLALLNDGRVIDFDFSLRETRGVLTFILHQPDGTVIDTVPLPDFERASFVIQTENSLSSYEIAFSPALRRFFDPRGYLWFGVSDSYRIIQVDLTSGDTLRIIEKDYDPVSVSRAERDAALESYDRLVQHGGRVDPSRFPTEHPAFADLIVDQSGFLWVTPATPQEGEITESVLSQLRPATFDVFDDSGTYLGRVATSLPLLRPKITEQHLYGTTLDDLGVQYLVRMRIDR